MRRLALAGALALSLAAPAQAAEGEDIYAETCAACHQADGRGIPGVYPPLADRLGTFVRVTEGRSYLARVLIYGLFGPIRVEDRPYNGLMPPLPHADDAELADVLNYVLTELDPEDLPADFEPFTAAEVASYRTPAATPSQMRGEREALIEKLQRESRLPRPVPVIAGTAEDYSRQCQGCHRADGMGGPGAVPRLRAFAGWFTHLPEGRDYVARVPGVVYAPIDDQRLADVLNWMLSTFSPDELAPDFEPYTAQEVAAARAHPVQTVKSTRKRLVAELQAAGIVPADDDGLGPRRD